MEGDETTEVMGQILWVIGVEFELYYEHTVGSHIGVSIKGGEFISF